MVVENKKGLVVEVEENERVYIYLYKFTMFMIAEMKLLVFYRLQIFCRTTNRTDIYFGMILNQAVNISNLFTF